MITKFCVGNTFKKGERTMDLRCRKTGCKYNKNLTCTACHVNIANNLFCQTYKDEKGKEIKDFSVTIFTDTPPKIADYRHIKDACLHCKAKCLFNKDGYCLANGITVNAGISKEPKCITFLKP